jgi:hypothetical protein
MPFPSRLPALVLSLLGLTAPSERAADAAPNEGTCADAATVERLLTAELRGDRLGPDAGWRLRYRVESSDGDRGAMRVTLFGDDGRLYLTRALYHASGDCQTLAEATAVIVDRFVTDLDWTSGRPLQPPATIAAMLPPLAPPVPVRAWLTAGAGVETRSQRLAAGALGLRLERGAFDGALTALLPAADQAQTRPGGGKATLSTVGAALSVGGRWQLSRLQLRAGPIAVIDYEWARTEGITLPKNNTRFTLAVGAAAGAAYAVSPRWRVGVDLWTATAVLGNQFVVEGWGPVLAPPRFQATALLGVACALAP